MSKRKMADLTPHLEEALARIRGKHPHRTSACGALLSEITSADATIADRRKAASLHGFLACKRGLKTLSKLPPGLVADIQAKFSEPGSFPCGPERQFLGELWIAIAKMDTQTSHDLLKQCFFSIPNPHLRADVLEAMAFEDTMYDTELILGTIADETEEPILLSGLYALLFEGERIDPAILRARLSPFLQHESWWVREYTVRVLMQTSDNSRNREIISKLANDPEPFVRETVEEALRWIDSCEEG